MTVRRQIAVGKIDSLTSLRFFAIMMVVVHHLHDLIGWAPYVGWGNVGVTFFFVLSGFVLTLNYHIITTFRNAGEFLWRRIVRVYPLHLVTLLMSIPVLHLYHFHVNMGFVSTLANLFLIQSWFRSYKIHFAFNGLSWAISTLVFSYVSFAYIQRNFRKNMLIAIFLSLTSLVLSIAYLSTKNGKLLQMQWLLQMFPINRIFVFLLGMLAAKLFLWFRQWFGNLTILTITILELITISLIIDRLSSCILLNNTLRIVFLITGAASQLTCQVVDTYVSTPVAFGLMIFVFSMQRGLISRLFSIKQFVFLGKMSFAIYLSHQLVFRFLSALKLGPMIPTVVLLLLAFSTTMVLSYFLFRYVEQPSARRLRNVFSTYFQPRA